MNNDTATGGGWSRGAVLYLLLVAVLVAVVFWERARNVAFPELLWLPVIVCLPGALRWWQVNVNERRGRADRVPAHAVLLALVFCLLLSLPMYALSRALWMLGGSATGPVFIGIVWALAAAAAGGMVGFLFGISRPVTGNGNGGNGGAGAGAGGEGRQDAPVTNLEQISQWLATAIAGGTMFQASRLGEYVTGLGTYFAEMSGLYAVQGIQQDGWLKVLGSASVVYFVIVGFLASYLLTKLFLVGAIRQADGQGGEELVGRVDLPPHQVRALREAPLTVADMGRKMSAEAKSAAERIARESLETLSDWRDLMLYGKAKLSMGEPLLAVDAYRRAIEIVPDEPELRLGLATALMAVEAPRNEAGNALLSESVIGEILAQIEAARDSLRRNSRVDLRKDIYKSLTYAYLYLKPPDAFYRAAAAGREYFAQMDSPQSAGISLNMACAFGQALKFLKANPGAVDPARMHVERGFDSRACADDAKVTAWLVEEALAYAGKALQRKPQFAARVKELAGLLPDTDPNERDLDAPELKVGLAKLIANAETEQAGPATR